MYVCMYPYTIFSDFQSELSVNSHTMAVSSTVAQVVIINTVCFNN